MSYREDELDLRLLRFLLSGEGVHVNVSELSRELDIHWATAKKKLQSLYDQDLLTSPFYPFVQLFEEYPLLVLVKADMPRTQGVRNFYRDDSHIFAAFSCMEGFYNTFLIEFFEGLEDYHSWRSEIVEENKIPDRGERTPAQSEFFSNRLTFKYEPTCFIHKMMDEFEEKGFLELNGRKIEAETFRILEKVMNGEAIRTNYSYIGREIGANRKTVKRRIDSLLDKNLIADPKCYFPNLLIPPGYNLIVTMIEATSGRDEVTAFLKRDDNVPRAVETSTERYNFLVFSAFESIEEFFEWGERLNSEFPEKIGAISKTILSSRMMHILNPQKVSLGFIERRLWDLKK
ncbi:MAG: hypothetical protein V5A88_03320 [Candidatus Thermoplasmatota archaeon]